MELSEEYLGMILRIYYSQTSTPIGRMVAASTAKGLCGLEFNKRDRLLKLGVRFQRWYPGYQIVKDRNAIINRTFSWLSGYYAGHFESSRNIALDLRGTSFELLVWNTIQRIPRGCVCSYNQLATLIGRAKAGRAVGAAVGRNPVGIIMPCHRVLGADGSLTGYGGGLTRKVWLLRHEKVLLKRIGSVLRAEATKPPH